MTKKAGMAEETKLKRLCSEIQLFDLCSKEDCRDKDGRYCSNSEMLARFEAISEDDAGIQDQFIAEEDEYDEESDDLAYEEDGFDDFDNEYDEDE
jgi:hypothetical protein